MTLIPARSRSPEPAPADAAARALARQLAAAGLKVEVSHRRDTCDLTIAGAATGKSLLALDTGGQARWYYEPATGPATSPATLAAIITHLLGEPPPLSIQAAYRALPVKGQVGRSLQDRGLTVVLRVSEDWESFEATTDIDITSPARPWLGTVRLSDDAALDWHCNWQAAFEGDPAALIGLIIPILRPRR
jgi:hypothetical protein